MNFDGRPRRRHDTVREHVAGRGARGGMDHAWGKRDVRLTNGSGGGEDIERGSVTFIRLTGRGVGTRVHVDKIDKGFRAQCILLKGA